MLEEINLEARLKEEWQFVKKNISAYGIRKIEKHFGEMEDLQISRLRNIVDYDSFYIKKSGTRIALPDNHKLMMLNKGIWPKYSFSGIFHDRSVKHSDYLYTSFTIYLSTNYSLSDYYNTSTYKIAGCNQKRIINPHSLFFLRDQGITSDLWKNLVDKDESIREFCLRLAHPKEKDRINQLVKQYFKNKTCSQMEYKSFTIPHNNFCNNWV